MRLRRTRIKICGITNVDDALVAAAAGADAIGLVFYPGSPRAVTIAIARDICEALPPFVTAVGLFVDAEPALVREVLNTVPLDLLQFHGAETAETCAQFDRPYIKALRMRDDVELLNEALHADCCSIRTVQALPAVPAKPSIGNGFQQLCVRALSSRVV